MTEENLKKVFRRLRRLEKLIISSNDLTLSMKKAVRYTGLSKSHLYKLTSNKKLPHYKPLGKMVFFRKSELDIFLLANKISTKEELEAKSVKIHSKLKR